MAFIVHYGRVQVTVNETTFRISKLGAFHVPRCKLFLLNSYPREEDGLANGISFGQIMSIN